MSSNSRRYKTLCPILPSNPEPPFHLRPHQRHYVSLLHLERIFTLVAVEVAAHHQQSLSCTSDSRACRRSQVQLVEAAFAADAGGTAPHPSASASAAAGLGAQLLGVCHVAGGLGEDVGALLPARSGQVVVRGWDYTWESLKKCD